MPILPFRRAEKPARPARPDPILMADGPCAPVAPPSCARCSPPASLVRARVRPGPVERVLRPRSSPSQYLEEPLTHEDPAQEAQLQALVDEAVAARLAGIPRPRYIPATDLAPPKGLILLKTDPRRGEFPFAMALGGYMQLRWFEFARDATQWTNAAGTTLPINNINTFNINRFLLSFHGHVVDERLVYNFAFFGTTNVGVRSASCRSASLGWKFERGGHASAAA